MQERETDAAGARAPDARGLPMVDPPDPRALEQERAWLRAVAERPLLARARAYLGRGGPGYLQSALTLGGGSASASLLAGAAFGYDLLWVAPLGMLLGALVFSAVAHQTLSTGERPFLAMRRHAGPVFAWGWALGALLASVVWHFAQYSLASAVVVDLGAVAGLEIPRFAAGLSILAWAVLTALSFGSGRRTSRWFERGMRWMVWTIVALFGLVAVRAGFDDPGAILRGFTGFRLPADRGEVAALSIVISGLAAAVGVNMLFLYPYTLLARGWGREHRELARFDLAFGMVLPYVFATGLMTVTAANTLQADFSGTGIAPVEAAGTLGGLLGPVAGRALFDLGLLAMLASTITLHMVCAGFVCTELFGVPFGSRGYKLALLIPTPGVLGSLFWSDLSVWLAVPTGVITGFLLPLAYIGFIKLQGNRAYLGQDRPTGARGIAWTGALVLATIVLLAFLGWYLLTKGPGFLERLGLLPA